MMMMMSCFITIQNGLAFLMLAYPGSPGEKAVCLFTVYDKLLFGVKRYSLSLIVSGLT